MSGEAVRVGHLILLGVMSLLLFGCDVLPDSVTANAALKERVNWYDSKRPSMQLTGSCKEVDGVSSARYCHYRTAPNPQYTIWFFHGAGDSERIFEYSPFSRESYVELVGRLGAVDIVTVSYGPIWLLTNVDERSLNPKDATVDIFRMNIIESLSSLLGLAPRRVAMGHSQGGTNVATICAARPDLWSKCILLNPMLPSCNPFSAWPVCPPVLGPLGAFGPNFLVRANYTKAQWPVVQPMVLLASARSRPHKSLPQFFVTACKDDEFGLYFGPKAWAEKAAELGFFSEWVEGGAKCNHFHWPARAVAEFLEKP
jgi:pimeloyl-ACP methyl ester carboxylesterase